MKLFLAFLSGLVFSLGLSISGMVNPNVVIGFLDIFGNWNPALLFVMLGAVAVNLVTFTLIIRRGRGYSGCELDLPTKKIIDRKLIIGSIIFGVGWGIFGVCPGPAIANLFLLQGKMLVFFVAMISGILIFKITS